MYFSTILRNMEFFLNSIRKIVIRVTSSKRYQNVRSDLTILGPFANVTLTLCVSWVVFAMSLCASVYVCYVVTCWERADLLALVCGV